MGINQWKWEGMGILTVFPDTSTLKPILPQLRFHLALHPQWAPSTRAEEAGQWRIQTGWRGERPLTRLLTCWTYSSMLTMRIMADICRR